MLALYRRHRQNCKAGHPRQFANTEFEERKKGWKRCNCIIFLSGTLQGKFKRTTTGQWEWDQAHAIAARYEAANSWNGQPISIPSPPVADIPPKRTTISEAVAAFLTNRNTANIQKLTIDKYRTMTNQLIAFAADKGFVYIHQMTITDCDAFYNSWKDGHRTRAKKLDRLKSFIKFCLKRKWLTENIAEDLKAPEGSSIPKQKTPFTDEDVNKLIAACDKIKRTPRRHWDGEDLKDFIYFGIYTGLRISDITLFDIDKRMRGNDIVLRALKNGALVSTWCPIWLTQRLEARKRVHGSLISELVKH